MRFQPETEGADGSPPPDEAASAAAYRILRRVAPPEVPFEGRLAHSSDGRTVLLVAAAQLEGWAGLDARDGGHVLAPCDLARLPDGLVVEFDWCSERLDRLLDARERAGVGLRAGEAITLAVSIRRGLGELAAGRPRGVDAWPTGGWWLTDSARPVFVHDERGEPADAGGRTALLRVAGLTRDRVVRAALERLAEADEQDAGAAESELFALADAEPVDLVVVAPTRVRSLNTVVRSIADESIAAAPARSGFVEHHLDAELSALASDALHGVLQRIRGIRPKPWQLAAACAALVLGAGVLWLPDGEGPAAATDDDASPPLAASAMPGASVSPEATAPPAAADTTTAIAARLLDARLQCGGDATCLQGVVEDPERALPPGAIDLPADSLEITLLDEFGGAAVLRVQGIGHVSPAQLVVIVESDGVWLLRDVHDVAKETG